MAFFEVLFQTCLSRGKGKEDWSVIVQAEHYNGVKREVKRLWDELRNDRNTPLGRRIDGMPRNLDYDEIDVEDEADVNVLRKRFYQRYFTIEEYDIIEDFITENNKIDVMDIEALNYYLDETEFERKNDISEELSAWLEENYGGQELPDEAVDDIEEYFALKAEEQLDRLMEIRDRMGEEEE